MYAADQASNNAELLRAISLAVEAAGRLVAAPTEASVPGEEVLFNRPTASAPALFVAVSQQAEEVR